jgi:predicted unusual protein kinase regulating ubiquinone biosynthesis (AarF/ABC1/UbiB family)
LATPTPAFTHDPRPSRTSPPSSPSSVPTATSLVSRLLAETLDLLKTLLRAVQLWLLCSPLLLLSPVALRSSSARDAWFRLLVATVELCGPVWVKLGQWASTRR